MARPGCQPQKQCSIKILSVEHLLHVLTLLLRCHFVARKALLELGDLLVVLGMARTPVRGQPGALGGMRYLHPYELSRAGLKEV